MNINHFSDLSKDMQESLLEYINKHFSIQKSYNYGILASAGSLKQHFTSTISSKTEHVTKQCFMEAMVKAGFKAKLISDNKSEDSENWIFNVYVKKSDV